MKDGVDTFKSRSNCLRIAHVSVNKLGRWIEKPGRVVSMNLGDEQVQHAHAMPPLNQSIGQVRADKPGAAGNKYA